MDAFVLNISILCLNQFASLVGIPIKIVNSSIGLKNCAITAEIKIC